MSFEGLRQGKYALREIAAPAGHALSNAESLVMVTRDAVYACAGTATDGIRVGNGPGYIVDTMREFATDGDVNTTLLWITTMLRGYRSKDGSYSFNDFYRDGSEWPFMMDETGKPVPFVGASRDARRAAMRAYLKYDLALTDDPRHSYSVDSDDEYEQHDSNAYGTGAQVKTPRLYTEVGWSTLEVYQDYWFGSRQMDGKNAEYTMLHKEGVMRDPNLVKLFSRSATVEFSDQQVSNLKVSKKVRDAASVGGEQQFTFNFILNDQKGAPITDDYAYRVFETVDDKPVVGENGAQIGGEISNGRAFNIKNGQYALITGLPASALVTLSEVEADDYETAHSVNGGDPAAGKQAKDVSLKWEAATAGTVDNTTTIHFVNSFPQPVDIALCKTDASLNATLGGAQFVLYREVAGQPREYFDPKRSVGRPVWSKLGAGENESRFQFALGKQPIYGLPNNATYYLKELKAPNGHLVLEGPVRFDVLNGKISKVYYKDAVQPNWVTVNSGSTIEVLRIPNSAGETLPNAGGSGTARFTFGGMALLAMTLVIGFVFKRSRGREDSA